jgi:hypothetical protein
LQLGQPQFPLRQATSGCSAQDDDAHQVFPIKTAPSEPVGRGLNSCLPERGSEQYGLVLAGAYMLISMPQAISVRVGFSPGHVLSSYMHLRQSEKATGFECRSGAG